MENSNHFEVVKKAISWLSENRITQPSLEELSVYTGYSPHYLQRTFQNWAGVSPKQFLKSLTREDAVRRLLNGASVLETSHASGLSGPGRLHDLLIDTDALSPGEMKKRGEGLLIEYGTADTPFGLALIAWSSRGVTFLGFCEDSGIEFALNSLRQQWHGAIFQQSQLQAQKFLQQVFSNSESQNLQIWLRGSPFQIKVWQALMAIPDGAHATYGQIAEHVGQSGAGRAVGTAIGKNPISWIVPCHRVIRKMGDLGGYRWGLPVKSAMIGYEAAHNPKQVHVY